MNRGRPRKAGKPRKKCGRIKNSAVDSSVVERPYNRNHLAKASAIIARHLSEEVQRAFMAGQSDCLHKMAGHIKDAAYIVSMNELASRHFCCSDCNEIATEIGIEMKAWAEGTCAHTGENATPSPPSE